MDEIVGNCVSSKVLATFMMLLIHQVYLVGCGPRNLWIHPIPRNDLPSSESNLAEAYARRYRQLVRW
jgi:hypothetical protein